MRIRSFPDKNYKAVYINGKTVRIAIDSKKPIQELDYPEFYDVKLTNRCPGNCPYCYQSSVAFEKDYEAVDKLTRFFGAMDENQRPFQIAYGGGEPTIHYQFHDVMRLTREFDISPNYTTSGLFIMDDADKVIETTKKYCEGVAVTCHKHLEQYWRKATEAFIEAGVFTNFHILIDTLADVLEFASIYSEWKGKVKYFVLLPVIEQGRKKNPKRDYRHLFEYLRSKQESGDITDIAFGSNFYPYLKDEIWLDVDLYEPEIMSKYLDLKDMSIYKSSFDTTHRVKRVEV